MISAIRSSNDLPGHSAIITINKDRWRQDPAFRYNGTQVHQQERIIGAMNTHYLDYAASTPLDQRVLDAMLPYFSIDFGNPSSIHTWGQRAENALEKARSEIAGMLHCQAEEIIFTSGGSESDNLALRGTAFARQKQMGAEKVLISPVEHPAVAETARQLQDFYGFHLEILPVDQFGRVSPSDLEKKIDSTTAVVSIIYANNEIGTINPIQELAEVCQSANIPFHTDAVQAAAHLPIDLEKEKVDLLSIGAHKFYGPKGIGVLFVRSGTSITPIQTGGKQEGSLRAGTHNIPYIVGLAKALQITRQEMVQTSSRLIRLREHLVKKVLSTIPDSKLTGHPSERLPNHASFVFKGVDGNELLILLDQNGFACSSGSACKVGDPKPSEVLLNLGYSPEWAAGSLRVTLGKPTSEAEVNALLDVLPDLVQSLRKSG
jgi:cysteine desulfurase